MGELSSPFRNEYFSERLPRVLRDRGAVHLREGFVDHAQPLVARAEHGPECGAIEEPLPFTAFILELAALGLRALERRGHRVGDSESDNYARRHLHNRGPGRAIPSGALRAPSQDARCRNREDDREHPARHPPSRVTAGEHRHGPGLRSHDDHAEPECEQSHRRMDGHLAGLRVKAPLIGRHGSEEITPDREPCDRGRRETEQFARRGTAMPMDIEQ
jgi:hypothetical protein